LMHKSLSKLWIVIFANGRSRLGESPEKAPRRSLRAWNYNACQNELSDYHLFDLYS
jgi:hypothetical protein